MRDARNLFLVTVSPAFLLFLLSYIFSFDVNHIDVAALDLDLSPLSRRYLASLASDSELSVTYSPGGYPEAASLLRQGDVDAVLVIAPGFANAFLHSQAPQGGTTAQVQAIIDGTDPFVGSQAMRSLEVRSMAFGMGERASGGGQATPLVEVHSLAWYNAGVESLLSMVPGLLAIVLLMPTLAFALAIVREKESGSLESLLATPVTGLEYLTGKLCTYILAGLVSAVLALLVAILWFKVPFRGSLVAYLTSAAIYFLACMGTTIVVAHFVKSQQAAMFIVLLLFMVPGFFLAGLITPVTTDSIGSMLTSYALPSTHFVEASRTIFLKGLSWHYLARPNLVLLGMGLGATVLGLWLFRKKLT
jgi:ABC-2 type transport system permease protein